jgi:MtN3 and saliva related transmembrane protein
MIWATVGITASVLTMFSFVPQIARSLRTKSVKDVSPITLGQLFCGAGLWAVYGFGRRDMIMIVANSVTVLTLLILICLYFKYGRSAK